MEPKAAQATAGMVIVSLMLGFMGVFTRYLGDQGLDSLDIAFVRALFTVIVLLPMMFIFYRKDLRPGKKFIPLFLIFGLCRLGTDITLFYAQSTVTLALATLLQMTFPYYVMFISLFVFKEAITSKKLIAVLLGFFGAILITGVLFGEVGGDFAGIIAALLSGVLIGFYIIGCGLSGSRGIEPVVFVFYAYVVSALFSLPFVNFDAVSGVVTDGFGLLHLLAIAVLMTAIPEFMTVWSTKYIRPTTVSIICVLELVAATFAGAVIYDEVLGVTDVIGVILVILSVVVLNVRIKIKASRYFEDHEILTHEEIMDSVNKIYR